MTQMLPGYGAGLTDDLILGHVAWYTVTKPRLTHDDIMTLIADLKLDPNIVPKPPRAGDAFKRACRYSEVSNVPIPLTADVANFMFRPVAQTIDEIERHLVVEVLDPQGRKLSHHTVAELRFERKNSNLHVKVLKVNQGIDPLTKKVMDDFATTATEATMYIEAQVIRRMIRAQLENCNAILARSKGSVYFVPKRYKDKLEALEQFLSHCGVGSGMHTLPLVDDTKQQKFISNAFSEGVHDTATQIISELKALKDQESQVTVGQFNDYKKKLDNLTNKALVYDQLVDVELSQSQIELKAVTEHLEELLMSGRIKT